MQTTKSAVIILQVGCLICHRDACYIRDNNTNPSQSLLVQNVLWGGSIGVHDNIGLACPQIWQVPLDLLSLLFMHVMLIEFVKTCPLKC